MTCRCEERRAAIKRIHEARLRGDMDAVHQEMRFIAQSSIEDMIEKSRDAMNARLLKRNTRREK